MGKSCKCGAEIQEYDKLFKCNECDTKIWKKSHGYKFKEHEIYKLFNGQTLLIKGFMNSQGLPYDTKVHINNGDIELIFDDETRSTTICSCSCGGDVVKIPKGYKCESCEQIVWEKFVNKELKPFHIKQLFKGESLFFKNLKSKKGNCFNASLFLENQELQMEYVS